MKRDPQFSRLPWGMAQLVAGKGSYERVTSLKYVGEGHGSISKEKSLKLVTVGPGHGHIKYSYHTIR